MRSPITCAPIWSPTLSPTLTTDGDRRPVWSSTPTAAAQYTSAQYAHLANQLNVTLSVGRTGQSWDNAVAESFFASLRPN